MAKSAWITPAELTAYLTGLGLSSIPAGITLQDEIDGAVAVFEKILGISPYLAIASDSYDYSPPRSAFLDLGGSFTAITVIKTGKSLTDAGTAQTEGQDYWLRPFGGPYTSVELSSREYGDPDSIEVTGTKGVTANIAVDLWNGVRDYAAAGVLEMGVATGLVTQGPVSRVKQGGLDVEVGNGSKTAPYYESLRDRSLKVFKSYRRPACVGLSQ